MAKKLNRILLIDDDAATNFLHKMVIQKANCTEEVVAVTSGQAALDFLVSSANGTHSQPDLIFLDVNMPGMNGWAFLEKYEELQIDQKAQFVVVMLTTSLNPDDKAKAEELDLIKDFKSKPLTEAMLQEVINQYF